MQETTHILRTKLHHPPVRDDHVHRIRLIEKLNNYYQHNALTLVSAPAGYGKSYLVSCWLSENNIPFGWVSLREEDNDLHTFLQYLAASIQNVFPGELVKTDVILKASELPPLSAVANTLINELDEIDKEFVLVLDDYHNIKNEQIHSLINNLLQYPPDNLHLCIITRKDPPIKLGSLRAYNRMNEIRMKDLSFTVQEIQILYKNMTGLEIEQEISERLLERTEGWVTGLRLTALSINSVDELRSKLDKMKGDSMLITDYLIEEVLAAQSEEFQRYLIKTSISDEFCADLIEILNVTISGEKVSGIGGQEFIEWLKSSNLFVIPLDDENKWFRYHHLFREFLLKQLRKKSLPEQIKAIHNKAGEWFEKNKFVTSAIKHMLMADEPEKAAGIVENHSLDAMNSDQWRVLELWLQLLPEEILNNRLKLQIVMAWTSKQRFQLDRMYSALMKSKELLGDKPKKDAFLGEWFSAMGWGKTFVEGDISGSLDHLNKALKLIPERPIGLIRAETELMFAMATHISGKGAEAIGFLKSRFANANPENERYWERLQYGLSSVYMLGGELTQSYDAAKLLKDFTARNRNEFAEGWAEWCLGNSALQRFDLNNALQHFKRLLELRYVAFDRASIDGIIGLALAYQLSGMAEKADEVLHAANNYAEWTKEPFHFTLFSSARARINLLRGRISEAIKWENEFKSEIHFPSMVFFLSNPFITECRVMIAEGTNSKLDCASRKLENLLKGTSVLNYINQIIEILVLQSIVNHKQGHFIKAAKTMEIAIELAVRGNWVRPFIEGGNDVMSILDLLINKKVYGDYCKMLKETFRDYETELKSKIQTKQTTEKLMSEPLSQRENEILSLLAYGYKNKEIAEKIFLAPTTIKKHIYNIFQKFDVHSRIELISRAKETGFISK